MGRRTVAVAFAAIMLVAVAVPAGADACVCASEPLEQRLDDSDAALVGRVVSSEAREVRGARVRVLTVEVDQRVKGDVPDTLEVRSPSGSDCDLTVREEEAVGLLLTRTPDGVLLGNACSVVGAGELVAEGGEPRGGAIKVVLGLVILALVLSWALRRKARGVRPRLPGAPEP